MPLNHQEKPEDFGPDAFIVEEAENNEESIFWKGFRWSITGLLVLGMLYLFGFQNLFLYRQTPSSARQEILERKVDAEVINIPLNIIVLTTPEKGYGSERDRENVLRLLENANEIWQQAGITLEINKISFEELNDSLLSHLYNDPQLVINNLENYNYRERIINVLLVGKLGGINGVSFGGLRAVSVADYTTVFDFRALAHEVGHQLGLQHIDETDGRLMYQGANGFELSLEEIGIAREAAAALVDLN